MKKFVLLSFFLLLIISAKAQDRVISTNHDTIHCKIISISNERIRYEISNKDGSITGKSLPLSEVDEYTRSQQSKIISEMDNQKSSRTAKKPEYICILGLNAGGSTMPWYFADNESAYDLPDYYNKLKTGFHANANIYYVITDFLAAGAEYSFLKTSTSGNTQKEYSSSMFLTISEELRQYINYVGPSVLFQQHPDKQKKLILRESLSAGVLFYRLENQITYPNVDYTSYTDITNNMLLTGSAFSAKFGLAAEYKLFRDFSVGIGGDYIWGLLKKASFEFKGSNHNSYSNNDQELSKAKNLSRFDYSIVLRYHF